MKRTLALILSLVMCLGLLAGCGDKNTKMFFLHKKIPFPIRDITDLCNCYTYIVPYLKGDV